MSPIQDQVTLWDRVRLLPLEIQGHELQGLELVTNSSYRRLTTLVHLHGGGQTGRGEEVGWDAGLQEKFLGRADHLPLAGEFTLESFSDHLQSLELCPDPPPIEDWRHYRRWAFESAALDLALRQNALGLEEAFGPRARPLHFCISLGLHSYSAIGQRLSIHPDMRFKLDATPSWTGELCAQLGASGAVDVVDFKGAYIGTPVDVPADSSLYARVLDAMPGVIVEDPHDEPEILALLEERDALVAWDAPIHSVAAIGAMPIPPRALNIKPSRFGRLELLLEAYDHCREHGLSMYGGGQFELGPGREQCQALAALFHPDGPNDVAPRGYHQLTSPEERPASPLSLNLSPTGFGLSMD